ncbi:Pls/PosA family non-ribosomal peptide synthetase [Microvirga sp. W0021]|uniref:Pls/PosA family non-ribosomal peptide synthetase n=1 Tax=Hohaiivirga grylli TaxID=3133970 RepID=A0ABV0BH36_9HYPH
MNPPKQAVLFGTDAPDLLRDEVLYELFHATQARVPEKTAFISRDQKLSFGQATTRVEHIARGLVRHGIGPGHVVGLWMPRSIDLLLCQIAVTRVGAVWLPFDAEAPAERVAICMEDAGGKLLIVTNPAAFTIENSACKPVTPPALIDETDSTALPIRPEGVGPESPAYLIYTSGSTGTPKGIVISHRNICHFLRSANATYEFLETDICFQGASVAFDLSMEEIWVPYLVGATLYVADPQMMGDVENLPDILENAGVTVIDTVPTLLALLPRDVETLRLILLGGEALPAPLLEKWSKPGRRLFNTYGPTEATVVATALELKAGQPVTIGKPIPNYSCYVVNEALELVAPGVEGELLLGGPGIAQGYLLRPELTAEKFIKNPFADNSRDPVLYRSGDAVVLDKDGNLEFHGRLDDQVKIRGFRVELGEIEAKVAALKGVQQAAVILRQADGIDRLVAFLVLEDGAVLDQVEMRHELREQMPAYMVPGHFEIIKTLPRLTSGKTDRKALKTLSLTATIETEQDEPENPTEAALLEAARGVFGGQAVPFEADFFIDLGGHSLLAARFVSAVRLLPGLSAITLQDVYNFRTLRKLSNALIERTGGYGHVNSGVDLTFTPPPFARRFLCGLAQAMTLPIIIALATTQWLGAFVTYLLIAGEGHSLLFEIIAVLTVYALINFVTAGISIAAKWLVLGQTKPGRYPLWGTYYFRWWFVRRLNVLVHIKWIQGSPIMNFYLRLLGAKVGRDAVIGDVNIGAPDLLSIGARTTTGGKVIFANAEVVGNELIIGHIDIGDDVVIGASAVVGSDTKIGNYCQIGDLTTVPNDSVLPEAEIWDGSPGRKVGDVDIAELPEPADASKRRRMWHSVFYIIMVMLVPAISLLPIFPAFIVLDGIDDFMSSITDIKYVYYMPLLTWPAAMCLSAFTVLFIALVRWVILPKVNSGTYSVFSGFYLRKWTVAFATEVTLETLSSLYATIYMRAWYRLMGAKIGKGAEISTNLAGRYDVTEIGAGNFIADEVVYGEEEIQRGWMTILPAKTGDRVFVGNDAVLPPGADIPEGVLIGIKSKPPANELIQPGDTWFGSPPIKLPTRQRVNVDANWTYEPGFWRKFSRGVFEALHTSFATMLFITLAMIVIDRWFLPAILLGDIWGLIVRFIIGSVFIAIMQVLCVVAVKWLMMGAYKPTMKPMWSWWAMRTEAVAVLYWGLAGKVMLEHLQGTPFLPWVLRLFGTKVGKGICMHTTDITEFDCVTIGDFCTINAQSALQTHLYEDRVMKVGRVKLADGVTVGANATVLYDSHVGSFAQLSPLTIVMKGESIPENTAWQGAPAVPVTSKN